MRAHDVREEKGRIATVHRRGVELQFLGAANSYSERYDDAVENGRYVVQTHPLTTARCGRYSCSPPDCGGGENPPDRLPVETDWNDGGSEPSFRFQQNDCESP